MKLTDDFFLSSIYVRKFVSDHQEIVLVPKKVVTEAVRIVIPRQSGFKEAVIQTLLASLRRYVILSYDAINNLKRQLYT